jgi:glutamate/tyrosine decarboxylase-like PLP-dependent enzyme
LRQHDSDRRHWAIKEELNESGFGYISSTVLDQRRVMRLVVMNPRTTVSDIHRILARVEQIASRGSRKKP